MAVYNRFGLNARQIEIVARATPKRDYYLQTARGNRLFELGLGLIALSLCGASSPADLKLVEDTAANQPKDRFARAFLKDKGLGWAADLLDQIVRKTTTAVRGRRCNRRSRRRFRTIMPRTG